VDDFLRTSSGSQVQVLISLRAVGTLLTSAVYSSLTSRNLCRHNFFSFLRFKREWHGGRKSVGGAKGASVRTVFVGASRGLRTTRGSHNLQ
jgi:hypothetical protein